jgi:hypothetical protein
MKNHPYLSSVQPWLFAVGLASVAGLSWSAAGATRSGLDVRFPAQTLWVTAPRVSAGQQSSPWLRKGVYTQGNAASEIDALGNNAAASSSSQPGGPNNTATGVIIPLNTDYAITPLLGDSGNYVNTFQGSVEATTPLDFNPQAGSASWADLYELLPGTSTAGTLNTAGRYLGTFTLTPDGTLRFSNTTPPPTAPRIAGIQVSGPVATISFQSVQGVIYVLRSVPAAGLNTPRSGWKSGPSVVGDGLVVSLQSTNTDAVQFYTLEAKP